MQEKRKFKRFKETINIKYTTLNTPNIEEMDQLWDGESQLLDISKNGVLFNFDVPLPLSSLLELEIQVPNRDIPIYLTGKIVRVEEVAAGQAYEIGFIFSNIFEKDLELLNLHLSELEQY